ncbi:MAG: class I SAM-dependent methyltransferase, partial [Rhodospirillales bacterium]|nr:class I SAM-dependent methyltransferase [Rhodospirillales bacterium]
MTSDSNDHNKSTREAYHPLHLALIENAHSSTRLSSLVSTELLKLPEGFFEGKKCADLGCGSGAFGAINLLQMGAKYVHAMDLDGSFIAPAQKSLSKDASFEGRWQTDIGSVDDLPYDDGFFDFILCQGVIMLTADDQKSVDEIARTLKPGGKAFVTVMGKGGLATRMMMDVFRDEYHNNPEFEHFVEHDLNPEWIGDQVDYLLSTLNP